MDEYIIKEHLLFVLNKCVGVDEKAKSIFRALVNCLPAEDVAPVNQRISVEERERMSEYKYFIACGSIETMETLAKRGKTALNPKTHKWQIIDKNADYKVVQDSDISALLYCDRNLKEIAKEKGLIY